MVELIATSAQYRLCPPFGCLPTTSPEKCDQAIRERFPIANIIPVDYDASASPSISSIDQAHDVPGKENVTTQRRLADQPKARRARVAEELKF